MPKKFLHPNREACGTLSIHIFGWILCVFAVDLLGEFFNLSWAQHAFIDVAKITLPILLLFTHACYILTLKRALFFIGITMLTGFLAEFIGIRHGSFFGELYAYNYESPIIFSNTPLFPRSFIFKGVPFLIPLFWSVFIYAGYSLSSSFLFWVRKDKPARRKGERLLLLFLTTCDAIFVLTLDLFIDPLLVRTGNWQWAEGSVYYGIPPGNYIGWFLVAFLTCGIFRVYEYIFPAETVRLKPSVFLMPPAGYLVFWGISVIAALQYKMYFLIFIGLLTIIPLSSLNLLFYLLREDGGKTAASGYMFRFKTAMAARLGMMLRED